MYCEWMKRFLAGFLNWNCLNCYKCFMNTLIWRWKIIARKSVITAGHGGRQEARLVKDAGHPYMDGNKKESKNTCSILNAGLPYEWPHLQKISTISNNPGRFCNPFWLTQIDHLNQKYWKVCKWVYMSPWKVAFSCKCFWKALCGMSVGLLCLTPLLLSTHVGGLFNFKGFQYSSLQFIMCEELTRKQMETHSHLPRHFPSDGGKAAEWII